MPKCHAFNLDKRIFGQFFDSNGGAPLSFFVCHAFSLFANRGDAHARKIAAESAFGFAVFASALFECDDLLAPAFVYHFGIDLRAAHKGRAHMQRAIKNREDFFKHTRRLWLKA